MNQEQINEACERNRKKCNKLTKDQRKSLLRAGWRIIDRGFYCGICKTENNHKPDCIIIAKAQALHAYAKKHDPCLKPDL